MHFLYLGRNKEHLEQLRHNLQRGNIQVTQTSTPEHAFFLLLNESFNAIFIDSLDSGIVGHEVLASLESIHKDVEIVLIADPDGLDHYNRESLRRCFGYITHDVQAPHNLMVLNQLTDKITIKLRLEKLRNHSIVDGLTQLYNHAYIQQQLDEEIRHCSEPGDVLSFVIFDIDNFKNYNDTNGHPAGDRVLKGVAEIMMSSVRKFDLTGRYGGEEFVIVLPGTKLTSALRITERFRKKIAETKFEYGHLQPKGFVSASFGVATYDGKEINEKKQLIELADQALYRAKRGKKNCIWYYLHEDFHHYQPSLLN